MTTVEDTMRRTTVGQVFGAAALAACMAFTPSALAQQEIKIGVLATLEGPFAVPGQDSMRGAELALSEHNFTAGGRKIVWIKASSNANPDVAVNAARKLVEQDKVDILIGPLSGSEGLAVKEYSKTRPETTFVNGTSAAQDTTLRNPSPNFYRFTTDGAQWQAGLGEYAVKTKGYKRMALIAEDYSFPYTQVLGFMTGFCEAGGKMVEKFWVPLGTKDYSSVIARIPQDIDAIYVVLGGSDAVNFFTQYQQGGGNKPMVGGSITVDQTVLATKGRQRDYVIGTASAGPVADAYDGPKWKAFVDAYKKKFPDGLPSPGLFAHGYYIGTKAVLLALDQVKGDLSGNHAKFRAALASLKFETPTGMVSLDQNRQAIADIFLTEVAARPDGGLYNKVVKVIPQVDQAMGMNREKFLALGPVSRTNPECK
jgi:branched-chain amino acid transport system substrate-binding protein